MLILKANDRIKRVALSITFNLKNAYQAKKGLHCLQSITLNGPTAYLVDCIYTMRERDVLDWAKSESMHVDHRMTGYCEIYHLESGAMPVREDQVNFFILIPKPDLNPATAGEIVTPPKAPTGTGPLDALLCPWWTHMRLFAPLPPARPDVRYRFAVQTPIAGGIKVDSILELTVGDTVILKLGQQIRALNDDPRNPAPVSFMHSMHHAVKTA